MEKRESNIDYEFLLRCLQSPADNELQQALTSWLQQASENSRIWQELTTLWELSGTAVAWDGIDVTGATKRFSDRLAQLHGYTMPFFRLRWLYLTAAACLVMIMVAIGFWPAKRQYQSAQWVTKATQENIDSVLLPDHSKVYLNRYAVIRYPIAFGASATREMTLDTGEAFFEVAGNPTQAFIVHSGNATVRVLGTSFNMRVSKANVVVTVVSGKVLLQGAGNQGMVLDAGWEGLLDPGVDTIGKRKADPNISAWKTGRLIFQDAAITTVFRELSRYYRRSIIYVNPKPIKLTSSFNVREEKLEDVLELLSAVLGDISYEYRGDTIYVRHRKIKI
ncbi:FecR family protein [Chitinophaga sp. Hz27]|uniref:FecR family protein n=1 Tax=Chitinophaga sp. Hz27 TaxID=3347169 RepID=UPI0035D79D64